MSITKVAAQGQLASGDTTVYTAPSNGEIILGSIMFHNTDAASVQAEVYLVPTGETKGDSHRFIRKDLAVDETYKPNETISEPLNPGTAVVVNASAAAVINYRLWIQTRT